MMTKLTKYSTITAAMVIFIAIVTLTVEDVYEDGRGDGEDGGICIVDGPNPYYYQDPPYTEMPPLVYLDKQSMDDYFEGEQSGVPYSGVPYGGWPYGHHHHWRKGNNKCIPREGAGSATIAPHLVSEPGTILLMTLPLLCILMLNRQR